MKPLLIFLLGATLFATAGYAQVTADLPGLPAQPDSYFLDQWEKNHPKTAESGAQPTEYFFTGKPYDADLGGFLFKYRNYDPELNRWTSADPSGFPDGVNNRLYTASPLSKFDPDGLLTISNSNPSPATQTSGNYTVTAQTLQHINSTTFTFNGYTFINGGTASGQLYISKGLS